MRTALWWGRFDAEYSRNRILRGLLPELGWRIEDYHPCFSSLADWEAHFRRLPTPDLVWVPCFRQRDVAAACRWARSKGVPLLFDPLISAYDKQVLDRKKHAPGSIGARRLRTWESRLFQAADIVLADTTEHARFFLETLGVSADRLHVVYVGAEEPLFQPGPVAAPPGASQEALFYGSFISLQGAPFIIEAAKQYQGPPLRWTLIGSGPELARCQHAAAGMDSVRFEPWVTYSALPKRIHKADILLGVFGTTPKAARVIPNKVFQALACGKPVVTMRSPAYPTAMAKENDTGFYWVEAGDPGTLARAVERLARELLKGAEPGRFALETYTRWFSNSVILNQLREALQPVQGLRRR